MRECMHTCMHVCMYIFLYVCTYARTYIWSPFGLFIDDVSALEGVSFEDVKVGRMGGL